MDLIGKYDWLQGLETPFIWRPTSLLSSVTQATFITHLMQVEQMLIKKKVFTFNNFVLRTLLAYELLETNKNSTASLLKLDDVAHELDRLDITSQSKFYREIRRAQWHVVLASEAVVLALDGKIEESKEKVGDNFDPVSTFTSVEMAGIFGIRSRACLEYGSLGWSEALKWAREAIKANPNEPEWFLLAGMAMERTRMKSQTFDGLPKDEISFFEKAVSLSTTASHPLYVARVFDQLVMDAFRKHAYDKTFKGSQLYEDIKELTKRIVQIYRNTLQNNRNCTNTKIKCLEGLVKIPRQFVSDRELRDIIDEISQIPKKSKRFYNAAATYFLKVEKNKKIAMRFLMQGEDAGDFSSMLHLLRLRIKNHEDVNVEGSLLYIVDKFKHHPKYYESALAHLGSFYLFKERDLSSAVSTFTTLLNKNPYSSAMLRHKSIFVHSLHPLNLAVITVNELKSANVVPGRETVMPAINTAFMNLISKYHTNILNLNVDVHMMDRILELSDKLAKKTKIPKNAHIHRRNKVL